MRAEVEPVRESLPSRREALVFRGKATVLQARRWLGDRSAGVRQWEVGQEVLEGTGFLESRSVLFAPEHQAERRLQLGKVQNLRLALKRFDGMYLPAGEMFSFWAQLGRVTAGRGYVEGRELREGCLIPSVGGGICQLSNSLYDLALKCGAEILERHAHTQAVPGSAAMEGRDATVFWNYIDLRFRLPSDLRVRAFLTEDELVLRFHGEFELVNQKVRKPLTTLLSPEDHSCVTCGQTGCFRHRDEGVLSGRQAFVLDALWPEFERLLGERAEADDTVLFPLDGRCWRVGRYRLPGDLRARTRFATGTGLRRMVLGRRAMAPPVARQFQLEATDAIAEELARKVPYEAQRVVVDIRYLPALMKSGVLGGRTYEVWVMRTPLRLLQGALDRAFAANPEAVLLGDFRAELELVNREWRGLVGAEKVVTPHLEVARQLREAGITVEVVPWVVDGVPERRDGGYLYFPGPTAARKGAWEVWEVCRRLGVPVAVGGRNLEGQGFWDGVEVLDVDTHPLEGAGVVFAPSVFEDRPGILLRAQAMGIPVVTTKESGLERAVWVEFGDLEGMVCAVKEALGRDSGES